MPEAQQQLSDEDKKVLEEHHKNQNNPDHPAHKDHAEHGKWLKSVPKQAGSAAIFGAAATAGADAVKGALGG